VSVLHPTLKVEFRPPCPENLRVLPEDRIRELRGEYFVGTPAENFLHGDVHEIGEGLVDLEEPGIGVLDDQGDRYGGKKLFLELQLILQLPLQFLSFGYVVEVSVDHHCPGRIRRGRKDRLDPYGLIF